jgi:hypothetical protein
MTSTKKTWLSIIIAAVIIVGMMAVTVVGGTFYFIYSHIQTQFTPAESAEQQFAAARARFAGEQPLVEMRDDEPVLHRNPTAPRRELRALHALAYDPRAHKLVHIDVPMWLLRLVPPGNAIHISDLEELDEDRARLTLEDLERHGPGLVLDIKRFRSGQVLVWTD